MWGVFSAQNRTIKKSSFVELSSVNLFNLNKNQSWFCTVDSSGELESYYFFPPKKSEIKRNNFNNWVVEAILGDEGQEAVLLQLFPVAASQQAAERDFVLNHMTKLCNY